jgi:hypothetical protein
MVKVSKNGKEDTLYLELNIFPCGTSRPEVNLTISCPDKDTRFKTTLSDEGLKKFRRYILDFYKIHILDKK